MATNRHPHQVSLFEGNEEDGPLWSTNRPTDQGKASKMSGASALTGNVYTGGEHQQNDNAQAEGAVEAQPEATRTNTEGVAEYRALPDDPNIYTATLLQGGASPQLPCQNKNIPQSARPVADHSATASPRTSDAQTTNLQHFDNNTQASITAHDRRPCTAYMGQAQSSRIERVTSEPTDNNSTPPWQPKGCKIKPSTGKDQGCRLSNEDTCIF